MDVEVEVYGMNYIDLNLKNKSDQKRIDNLTLNKRATVLKNEARYIGRTEGAENNGEHSFFGRFTNGAEFYTTDLENMSKKDIMNYLDKEAKKGCQFYKAVFSLKEVDAINYGFTTKDKWKEFINYIIPTLQSGECYMLNNATTNYIAAFHTEKGHPHVHIIFWDEDTKKPNPYNSKIAFDKIRRDSNKFVYRTELENINLIKNENKSSKKLLEKVMKELQDIDGKPAIFDNKIKNKDLKEIISLVKNLHLNIKDYYKNGGHGRLNQKFLPKELKDEVREISKKIYNSSPAIKEQIDKYVDACMESEKRMTGVFDEKDKNFKNIIKVGQTQKERMFVALDNQILNYIKEIKYDKNPIVRDYSSYNSNYNTSLTKNIDGLLRNVYQMTRDENYNLRQARSRTFIPLQTKAQKREFYFKHKNTNLINWQEEQ